MTHSYLLELPKMHKVYPVGHGGRSRHASNAPPLPPNERVCCGPGERCAGR